MGFIECPTCAEKLGSPLLCTSCLSNRALIDAQQITITNLRDRLAGRGFDKPFCERLVRELRERRDRTIPGAVQVRQTIDLVIGAIEAALEGECDESPTTRMPDPRY